MQLIENIVVEVDEIQRCLKAIGIIVNGRGGFSELGAPGKYRNGTLLSGFCCVSSVPASCVHIWFVSCPCFMSL